MLERSSTTTYTPRYVPIEDFVRKLPVDMFEFTDSPLLPILMGNPTVTPVRLPELKIRLSNLESGYNLTRTVMINVRCVAQNNYVAEFTEANINASGESLDEALTNIRGLIVDMYDLLSAVNRHRLGPEPKNQRRVLRSIIRKSK